MEIYNVIAITSNVGVIKVEAYANEKDAQSSFERAKQETLEGLKECGTPIRIIAMHSTAFYVECLDTNNEIGIELLKADYNF